MDTSSANAVDDLVFLAYTGEEVRLRAGVDPFDTVTALLGLSTGGAMPPETADALSEAWDTALASVSTLQRTDASPLDLPALDDLSAALLLALRTGGCSIEPPPPREDLAAMRRAAARAVALWEAAESSATTLAAHAAVGIVVSALEAAMAAASAAEFESSDAARELRGDALAPEMLAVLADWVETGAPPPARSTSYAHKILALRGWPAAERHVFVVGRDVVLRRLRKATEAAASRS